MPDIRSTQMIGIKPLTSELARFSPDSPEYVQQLARELTAAQEAIAALQGMLRNFFSQKYDQFKVDGASDILADTLTVANITGWDGATINIGASLTFTQTTFTVTLDASGISATQPGYQAILSPTSVQVLVTGGAKSVSITTGGSDAYINLYNTTHTVRLGAHTGLVVDAATVVDVAGVVRSSNGFSGNVVNPTSISIVNGIVTACS